MALSLKRIRNTFSMGGDLSEFQGVQVQSGTYPRFRPWGGQPCTGTRYLLPETENSSSYLAHYFLVRANSFYIFPSAYVPGSSQPYISIWLPVSHRRFSSAHLQPNLTKCRKLSDPMLRMLSWPCCKLAVFFSHTRMQDPSGEIVWQVK